MSFIPYFKECAEKAIEMDAQDLFFKSGGIPRARVGGEVVELEMPPIKKNDLYDFLKNEALNEKFWGFLQRDLSVDFPFQVEGLDYRFRGNAFYQQGELSVVFRVLWQGGLDFEKLHLPPILKNIAVEKSGIIILAGTVASGKSTTIAAMLNHMNQTVHKHIVTVEDPVEFLYEDNTCLFNQREIGLDSNDFDSTLKFVARQSPDVVVIGEMRDVETFKFALNAAEVGRLVFATLHAQSVVQVFERIMGFFPGDAKDAMLKQFASNMTCINVQRLLDKVGGGLIPSSEILVGNYTMKKIVADKEFHKVPQALINMQNEGMHTMDMSIMSLFEQGLIEKETALAAATRRKEMENMMRGFTNTSSGGILGK